MDKKQAASLRKIISEALGDPLELQTLVSLLSEYPALSEALARSATPAEAPPERSAAAPASQDQQADLQRRHNCAAMLAIYEWEEAEREAAADPQLANFMEAYTRVVRERLNKPLRIDPQMFQQFAASLGEKLLLGGELHPLVTAEILKAADFSSPYLQLLDMGSRLDRPRLLPGTLRVWYQAVFHRITLSASAGEAQRGLYTGLLEAYNALEGLEGFWKELAKQPADGIRFLQSVDLLKRRYQELYTRISKTNEDLSQLLKESPSDLREELLNPAAEAMELAAVVVVQLDDLQVQKDPALRELRLQTLLRLDPLCLPARRMLESGAYLLEPESARDSAQSEPKSSPPTRKDAVQIESEPAAEPVAETQALIDELAQPELIDKEVLPVQENAPEPDAAPAPGAELETASLESQPADAEQDLADTAEGETAKVETTPPVGIPSEITRPVTLEPERVSSARLPGGNSLAEDQPAAPPLLMEQTAAPLDLPQIDQAVRSIPTQVSPARVKLQPEDPQALENELLDALQQGAADPDALRDLLLRVGRANPSPSSDLCFYQTLLEAQQRLAEGDLEKGRSRLVTGRSLRPRDEPNGQFLQGILDIQEALSQGSREKAARLLSELQERYPERVETPLFALAGQHIDSLSRFQGQLDEWCNQPLSGMGWLESHAAWYRRWVKEKGLLEVDRTLREAVQALYQGKFEPDGHLTARKLFNRSKILPPAPIIAGKQANFRPAVQQYWEQVDRADRALTELGHIAVESGPCDLRDGRLENAFSEIEGIVQSLCGSAEGSRAEAWRKAYQELCAQAEVAASLDPEAFLKAHQLETPLAPIFRQLLVRLNTTREI